MAVVNCCNVTRFRNSENKITMTEHTNPGHSRVNFGIQTLLVLASVGTEIMVRHFLAASVSPWLNCQFYNFPSMVMRQVQN